MKIISYSFSDLGDELGDKIARDLDLGIKHIKSRELDRKVSEDLKDTFYTNDAIVFIGATGIAVRLIAPFIQHKAKDPAIICIDDKGRFVISLLSGHLGGANELSQVLADRLGSQAVITTASDSRGIESIDLFAKRNNYHMEDMKNMTEVTRLMVDGKKILFYSEDKKVIDYGNLEIIDKLDDIKIDEDIEGAIFITSNIIDLDSIENIPVCILRPKNINIGIGCRKGVEEDRIKDAVKSLFKDLGLSDKSIKNFGSVEVKKDEEGIIKSAKYFNADFKIFTIDEIGKVEDRFNKSEFVKKTIGVYSVAEPSAYLLGGEFKSMRTTHNGITLSVTKEEM